MPDGVEMLKTLIELFEAQEQIKVTYTITNREGKSERKDM